MPRASVLDKYLQALLKGDRAACRQIIRDALHTAPDPRFAYFDVLWPAMQRVESLFRTDRINIAQEHMATRINRMIADQIQPYLTQKPRTGRRTLVVCAEGEPEELGAQMCCDLLEAEGWEVYFAGGGVPDDEVLSLLGELRPDLLVIFGTQPQGVPGVRRLIELIREIGINPTMNILVSGGVFNRAEGLWEEVCADLFAPDAATMLTMATRMAPRDPDQPAPATARRRRRRRRPAATASST